MPLAADPSDPLDPLDPLDLVRRERDYSPSSAIGGNYAPFLAQYTALSAHAHARLAARRDLRYGAAPRATLDYFPARAGAIRPGLLVYLHGGYWQEGTKADSAFLAPTWHDAGMAHAVVGYTLAPEARLPQIVAECCAALAWLVNRADTLKFDAANVVIAGSSAGGYLTAASADRSPVPVRGIVPVSGVFDVAPLIGTSINDPLGLDVTTATTLDLLTPERRYCPAVVAWGEVETSAFKRQSRAFAAGLRDAGTSCATLEVPGRNHFDVVLELGDRRSPLFAAALALFAR